METTKATTACKKYWKKGLAGVIALVLLGGCEAAWSVHQHHAEFAAKDAARSQLVAAQAARENVTLIGEDEAKAKAAEAIGADESALTYKKVNLENLAVQKDKREKEDKREKDERKDGFTALHAGRGCYDREGYGRRYEHDGDGPCYNDDNWHDGEHRMAPQGQPGMMQGAPQGMMGQPPMMEGQAPQGAPMAQDGQNADGTQAQPPMQPQAAEANGDTMAQAQNQRPRPHFGFHPAYKIACEQNGVKYHVLVDAASGDVMMCDVA